MKQLITLTLLTFIALIFAGCSLIPDLPGPIGIPGF
jgi:PBP1b-binding outer membrane lipoprotein LpoB